MPTFEYQALDGGGARVSGALAAASEAGVLAELESRRLTPVRVSARKEKRGGSVNARALGTAYAQLADLLRAGVPVMRTLTLLGRQKSKPALGAAFRDLADRVADGAELSEAMSEHTNVFPPVHIAMVRAGEQGGFLEDVFEQLGFFVTAQAELNAKVVGSLIYPVVLLSLMAIVLSVIFGVFVPMFEPMFSRLDQLPTVTVIVFGLSEAVTTFGPITAAVLVVAGAGLWRASKRDDVKRAIAVAKTKGPVLGPLVRALACARFCRLLGMMEAGGVPLLTAMRISRDAAGNLLMEDAIEEAAEAVRGGDDLAGPLGRSGLFPDDVIEMIAVGEAAGNIDRVLLNVAATIEKRIDRLLTSLVRLIEPALLLAIALSIGTIAVALILPMTQLSSTI
ncbi:MAG: type II secretion system F family protein [Planctomycetota bacterium]